MIDVTNTILFINGLTCWTILLKKYLFIFLYTLEDFNFLLFPKHLIFVYEEHGFRNGGLGDRLGGLVSAVAMSIRFGRQLLLRASNGLEEVFRPYHPQDIAVSSSQARFSWANGNWTSWSKYDGKWCCDDKTEYDLWMCINNVGSKNRQCGMHDGDVSQPHVLYRSNRAYLCSLPPPPPPP
jgi:hypothetical protein